jgi:hypothetical protein
VGRLVLPGGTSLDSPGPGAYTHSPHAAQPYSMLGDAAPPLSTKPTSPMFSNMSLHKTGLPRATSSVPPGPGSYSPRLAATLAPPSFSMRHKPDAKPASARAVLSLEPGPATYSPARSVPATRTERPQYLFGQPPASSRGARGSPRREPGPGSYDAHLFGALSPRRAPPSFSMGVTSAFKPVRIAGSDTPGPGTHSPTGDFGDSSASSVYSRFNRSASNWGKERGRSSVAVRASNWVHVY